MDELTALQMLRLQIEWGADEALLDAPIDRTVQMPPVAAVPRAAARPLREQAPARGPAPALAAIAAEGAADLAALHEALDRFDACPLRGTASRTVAPSGTAEAGLVVIGEAPGAEDDRAGQAFSGEAGRVLDRVLGSVGLGREALLLCFMVPWRPPGGRSPNEAEVAACLPFLHRLLVLARPRRLVLLGGGPLKALAGEAGGARRPRGRWTEVEVPGVGPLPALPMLPADQWLSGANAKQATWTALLTLREALGPA